MADTDNVADTPDDGAATGEVDNAVEQTTNDATNTDTINAAASPTAGKEAAKPAAKAEDGKTTEDDKPAAGAFPDSWRADWIAKKFADPESKEAKKALGRLTRYASPHAAFDALFSVQDKIFKGELKSPLAKTATEEEVKQWREENGIPADPKDYPVELSDGLVVGEQDQPIVDSFLEIAHAQNLSPDAVQKQLDWYFHERDRQLQAMQEQDMADRDETRDLLRDEWGGEAKGNFTAIVALSEMAGNGVGDMILGARLANGKRLANDPDALRWLVNVARELNPASTVTHATGAKADEAISTELDGLKKMMGDHQSEYWKGPSAEKNQARFIELTTAQQKVQARR